MSGVYWSASTGGFYLPELHGDAMPSDVVRISAEDHAALLDAQSQGRVIQAGAGGVPEAVVAPEGEAAKAEPTLAELSARMTAWEAEGESLRAAMAKIQAG